MPEGREVMAELICYLCSLKKSNASTNAMIKAIDYVEKQKKTYDEQKARDGYKGEGWDNKNYKYPYEEGGYIVDTP